MDNYEKVAREYCKVAHELNKRDYDGYSGEEQEHEFIRYMAATVAAAALLTNYGPKQFRATAQEYIILYAIDKLSDDIMDQMDVIIAYISEED